MVIILELPGVFIVVLLIVWRGREGVGYKVCFQCSDYYASLAGVCLVRFVSFHSAFCHRHPKWKRYPHLTGFQRT